MPCVIRITGYVICLILLLTISGCFGITSTPVAPHPELTDFLPIDWVIADNSQWINIDGDVEDEFLVFYTYDNSPIGAVIYDFQDSATFVTRGMDPISIPNQPSVLYVPYRVLPSYLPGMGQGFVASPGTLQNLAVHQVNRTTEPELREDGTPIPDELVIYDGIKRITFVWWRGLYEGYGLFQVVVPGYLFDFVYRDTQSAETAPPLTFRGHHPLNDRSLFCYQILYTRTDGAHPSLTVVDDQAIHYQQTPEGLHFCNGTPTFPFYPEGVVLAFLQNPNVESPLLDSDLSLADRERIVQTFRQLTSEAGNTLRVDEAIGQRTTEFADTQNGQRALLDTHVCAKVIGTLGAQAYYFTLRHKPPSQAERTTDRLFVTGVDPIQVPEGMASVNCHEIVERRS
ncbi:hypothetical protein KFU94_61780 [Chloroflexi bacterium TSY]|nr:hypothetical protein [Chloroflexi bacterium TSY]